MTEKIIAEGPDRYRFFHTIATRWMDNDVYGHVNNVHYYSYFDTAVGALLIEKTGLDFMNSECVAWVVDTHCSYLQSLAFPDVVKVGVRVEKLGTSSVRYALGVFKNDDPAPCAQGHFVHVYVNRNTNRPVPIPPATRAVLQQYML